MASAIANRGFFVSRLFKMVINDLTILNRQQNRHCIASSCLMYSEHGDPVKVVQSHSQAIEGDLLPDKILVKMLAAPVNPADINTIQGKYPVKPPLPSVPGNEGVAEVLDVGENVKDLEIGDRVIPIVNALGTWRSHAVVDANEVFKVPKKLGIAEACTLTVNPCTAFRMLRDFVSLKPGDTIIQNGANSAVGQNVIQICRVWGIYSVNIVRDRPDIAKLKQTLLDLGASHVLTEEELRTTDLFKTKKLKKPALGFNCVGGKSSLELLRHLDDGATMVTYGGMSREPVTIPTGSLIFKDLHVRGFWMTEWSKQNMYSCERSEMFEELISMFTSGEMKSAAYTMVPFKNFKEALLNTMTIKGMTGKKFILSFE